VPELAAGTPATLALMEPHADWDPGHIECRAERKGALLAVSGTKTLVLDGEAAQWIVTSVSLDGSPALVLLDGEAIAACERRRETVIDETRRSVQLGLDGVSVAENALLDVSLAQATLERIELAGSLLASAEMCGGGASCIDYTVAYLNTRKQFGRPIGSYQALKHPIVDAHVGIEQARSHLYAAAHTFEEGEEGEIAVRMAKAQAGPAFAYAADRAIQFHGGFGFTYECDAQLYRRRALWCESQHGDALYHRRKLADLIL
jgi:alkylation response protein AidB-like acyl-CoA dehydrogenase